MQHDHEGPSADDDTEIVDVETIMVKDVDSGEEAEFMINETLELDGETYVVIERVTGKDAEGVLEGSDEVFVMKQSMEDGLRRFDQIESELEFLRVVRALEEDYGFAPGTLVAEFDGGCKITSDHGEPAALAVDDRIDIALTLEEVFAACLGIAAYLAENGDKHVAVLLPMRDRFLALLEAHGHILPGGLPTTILSVKSDVRAIHAGSGWTNEAARDELLAWARQYPSNQSGGELGEDIDPDAYLHILRCELVRVFMHKRGIPLLTDIEAPVPPEAALIREAVMGFDPTEGM